MAEPRLVVEHREHLWYPLPFGDAALTHFLSERVAVLANRWAGAARAQALPAAVNTAAEHAASIAAQLAEHVPAGLRAITA